MPDGSGVVAGATPRVQFYRFVPAAPRPQRAERAAMGYLPQRAARYCDAATLAASFGWWLFPPTDFSLLWDGDRILWAWDGRPDWYVLDAAQFPHFAQHFDTAAPACLRGFSPPFLTALPESGHVQIWTGLFARAALGWSLLVRPPANIPPQGSYLAYEGIVEADAWFGPVFANIQLTKRDEDVRFSRCIPLLQVQPVPRHVYQDNALNSVSVVDDLADMSAADWADYAETIAAPREKEAAYAVAARRRRKCPMS